MIFKHKRNMSFLYFTFIMVIVALGLSLLLFVAQSLWPQSITVAHGPNPNTQITEPIPESVSEKEATPSHQPQDKVQDQSLKRIEEYGIAGGGGLVFFDQKDLDQYFSLLQSTGVKWIRWDIDWSFVQPDNSKEFQWERTDRVAATAKR